MVAAEHFASTFEVVPLKFDYVHADLWPCVPLEFDAVLHCAGGGMGLRNPVLSAAELGRLFMLNVGAACAVNQAVIPHMKARGTGHIVHVCSIASGEAVGSVGYNTVKGALAAYTRSLGREMAPYGLVVTGIAPGAFNAPGGAMDRLRANNPEAYEDFEHNRLPRRMMGDARELLPVMELLLSPAASMMAGTVIAVDAGEGKYYG